MIKTTLLTTLLFATITVAQEVTLFIGTPKKIHTLTFDEETAQFSKPKIAHDAPSSSFITLSKNKKLLLSTHTQDRKGAVASYSILPDNTLKLISSQLTGGNGTCHISTDLTGTCVFSADYGSGHLTSYKLSENGELSPPVTTIKLTGNGPNKNRQTAPHAHSIYPSPDNKHVYSADLGTDQINIYSLDPNTATLTPLGNTKVPPGSGPRHLALHPGGTTIYALNELTCTVSTLNRNPETGALTLLHTTPLFPADTQGISCSEIHLTPDNKHLYTGNRDISTTTKNSISHLTVPTDLTQSPTLKQTLTFPTQLQIPRHFTITPSGKYLLAGGQKTKNLLAIKRNPTTGQLTLTTSQTNIPSPTCVIVK